MQPHDLIATARKLASANAKRPRQSDLKRALSTAYYALFHCLAKSSADAFVGTTKALHENAAWLQTYRALSHGPAKKACEHKHISSFPKEVQDFGNLFVEMQEKRHKADYDPTFRVNKSKELADIETVRRIIERFQKIEIKDKKAFAAWVLFQVRA